MLVSSSSDMKIHEQYSFLHYCCCYYHYCYYGNHHHNHHCDFQYLFKQLNLSSIFQARPDPVDCCPDISLPNSVRALRGQYFNSHRSINNTTDRTESWRHIHLSSALIQASRWKRSMAIATMQPCILVCSSVEQISFSQTTSKCFICNVTDNALAR